MMIEVYFEIEKILLYVDMCAKMNHKDRKDEVLFLEKGFIDIKEKVKRYAQMGNNNYDSFNERCYGSGMKSSKNSYVQSITIL